MHCIFDDIGIFNVYFTKSIKGTKSFDNPVIATYEYAVELRMMYSDTCDGRVIFELII